MTYFPKNSERKPYPTDLTDEQWSHIEPLWPPEKKEGRPRSVSPREILNAILYVLRTGCAWRLLPHDFPGWSVVYSTFRRFKLSGLWKRIHDSLREDVREQAGRQPTPSAGAMDSQSVKTTDVGGVHGYDAGKKINGRKRHILVDTLGLLVALMVLPANIQDRDGAKPLLENHAFGNLPRLERIWADGGYAGQLVEWVAENSNCTLEIVKRSDDVKGFKVLPHRWIVERTFGWFNKYRRLSKDYERLTDTSESTIYLTMTHIMVRRLAPS
jgi:putative transposase